MDPERTAGLELRVRAPFDGAGLFGFFAGRGIPGVEVAWGDSYERVFEERGRAGTLRVELRRRGASHSLSMEIPSWASADGLSERAFRQFDLAANPRAIAKVLGARTLAERLVALCGRPRPKRLARPGLTHVFPSPAAVADTDVASVGLPRARAAHVVALRALGESDAFPDGDLGLVKAMERAGVKRSRIAARAERWRPYRAYATLHLWASLADGKGGA
ncbi:MAG: AlkA N-terminal domain-containing protein [Thermoanaerobaculia bacterium]